MIRLHGVSYSYPLPGGGSRSALTDVSLTVEEGDTLVVLGAQGAGKSTLGLLLAGVLHPDEGRVEGKFPDGISDRPPLPVGLVSQNPEDTFTSPLVAEEMGVLLDNLGWPVKDVDRLVAETLDEIGLGEHRDYPPSLLSGGQKQLLAIASVLVAAPACLVLDEHLSLLDSRSREEVSRLVSRMADGPVRSFVRLTSEVEDIFQGNRLAVLHRGRLVWSSTPEEFPLLEATLQDWGLLLPDLTRLALLLRDAGVDVSGKIWDPVELGRLLCRST